MFDFNKYVSEFSNTVERRSVSGFRLLKEIECKDGFKISVQASKNHYCQPRETLRTGYDLVECGFPNAVPEFILEYADDIENPTDTVYAYVPVELVNKLINHHGGVL